MRLIDADELAELLAHDEVAQAIVEDADVVRCAECVSWTRAPVTMNVGFCAKHRSMIHGDFGCARFERIGKL